jgi:hypothetical protein
MIYMGLESTVYMSTGVTVYMMMEVTVYDMRMSIMMRVTLLYRRMGACKGLVAEVTIALSTSLDVTVYMRLHCTVQKRLGDAMQAAQV